MRVVKPRCAAHKERVCRGRRRVTCALVWIVCACVCMCMYVYVVNKTAAYVAGASFALFALLALLSHSLSQTTVLATVQPNTRTTHNLYPPLSVCSGSLSPISLLSRVCLCVVHMILCVFYRFFRISPSSFPDPSRATTSTSTHTHTKCIAFDRA